jgi:hypothetical protein
MNSLLNIPRYGNPTPQANSNNYYTDQGNTSDQSYYAPDTLQSYYAPDTLTDTTNNSSYDWTAGDNNSETFQQCQVRWERRWIGRTFSHTEIVGQYFDGYSLHTSYRDVYFDHWENVPVSDC